MIGSEPMKHPKDRLTPREWAASTFIVLAFVGFSIFDADKLGQLIAALSITVGMLATGALILNWPEIKKSLKKENAPSRAETRTRRTKDLFMYSINESEEKVNV